MGGMSDDGNGGMSGGGMSDGGYGRMSGGGMSDGGYGRMSDDGFEAAKVQGGLEKGVSEAEDKISDVFDIFTALASLYYIK